MDSPAADVTPLLHSIPAAARRTGLSRTGDYSLVYAGELVGVALMFCGFTLGAAPPKRRQAPGLEPAVVAR